MNGPEGGAEARAAGWRPRLATASGRGDRPVLRAPARRPPSGTTVDSAVPSTSASDEDGGAARRPIASQRARDQLGDRRLGEHADDQVGDGDAELGAGELEGEVPYGLQGARRRPARRARPPVPARRARRWSARTPPRRRHRRPGRAAPPRAGGALRSSGHLRPMIGQGREDRAMSSAARLLGGSPMGGRSHLSSAEGDPVVKDRQSRRQAVRSRGVSRSSGFTQRRHCSSGAYPAARQAWWAVSLRSSTIASPRRPPSRTNRSSAAASSAAPMPRRRRSGCTASRYRWQRQPSKPAITVPDELAVALGEDQRLGVPGDAAAPRRPGRR